jgi:hypothetical protein
VGSDQSPEVESWRSDLINEYSTILSIYLIKPFDTKKQLSFLKGRGRAIRSKSEAVFSWRKNLEESKMFSPSVGKFIFYDIKTFLISPSLNYKNEFKAFKRINSE